MTGKNSIYHAKLAISVSHWLQNLRSGLLSPDFVHPEMNQYARLSYVDQLSSLQLTLQCVDSEALCYDDERD